MVKVMSPPAMLAAAGLLILVNASSLAQPAMSASPMPAQSSDKPASAEGTKQGANMMQQGGMECPMMKQGAQMAEHMQQMQTQMAHMMTMMQKMQEGMGTANKP